MQMCEKLFKLILILFQSNLNTLYEREKGGGVVEHYYELNVPVFILFFGILGSLREASQFEKSNPF